MARQVPEGIVDKTALQKFWIKILNKIESLIPQRISWVATAGQTQFRIPFAYDANSSNLTVYYNGLLMKETDNYTVNITQQGNENFGTITLVGFTAEAGDIITIMGILGGASIDFSQEALNAMNQINGAVSTATSNINSAVASANSAIDAKIQQVSDFANSLPSDVTSLATKTYVDNAINTATSSAMTNIFYTGSSAPSNIKLLWIDTNTTTGGLKYYNGSSWVHVPVAWS